jgi:TolA-binding protein
MAGLRRLALIAPVALIILMVLGSSCAYFNTFWLAKSDYGKAVDKGGFDFQDPYTQPKLQGEAKGMVESCIEQCSKLLQLHPDSKWADDALLLMGNCFVMRDDNANAMKKFDELIQIYSSSNHIDQARYMQAYTSVRAGQEEQAAIILGDLIGEIDSKDIQRRSTYLLARILHHQGDCERAVGRYTDHLEKYNEKDLAVQIRLNIASCMLKMGQAREVIVTLEPLADDLDETGVAARLRIGAARRSLGEYDEAVDILTTISESTVEDSLRARALMEVAQTMLAQDKVEDAIQVLGEASDIAREKAPSVKNEAVYKTGMIYEKRVRDFDQAVATYEQISKTKSEYGLLAAARAKAITAVKEYQTALSDSIPDSVEEEAKHRFMLAEHFMEDLDLPEKSLAAYKALADSFPETEFGIRAMLRTAAFLEAKGDTVARDYYRRVIELRPGSVYANVARMNLDMPLVDVISEVPHTVPPPNPAELARRAAEESESQTPFEGAGPDSGDVGRSAVTLPGQEDTTGVQPRRHLRPNAGPGLDGPARRRPGRPPPPVEPDSGGQVVPEDGSGAEEESSGEVPDEVPDGVPDDDSTPDEERENQ